MTVLKVILNQKSEQVKVVWCSSELKSLCFFDPGQELLEEENCWRFIKLINFDIQAHEFERSFEACSQRLDLREKSIIDQDVDKTCFLSLLVVLLFIDFLQQMFNLHGAGGSLEHLLVLHLVLSG